MTIILGNQLFDEYSGHRGKLIPQFIPDHQIVHFYDQVQKVPVVKISGPTLNVTLRRDND